MRFVNWMIVAAITLGTVGAGSAAVCDGTYGQAESTPTGQSPRHLAVGDFDSDGDLDLAVCAAQSQRVEIYFNDGFGDFTLSSVISVAPDRALAVDAGDLNGDTHLDLVVTNNGASTTDRVEVYLNDGTGNFAYHDGHVGIQGTDVRLANVLGSPALDVLVVAETDLLVYINDGTGVLGTPIQFVVGDNTREVEVADLDLDGFLDVVTADQGSNKLSVFMNQGGMSLAPALTGPVASVQSPQTVELALIDGDAYPDAVVTEGYYPARVWVHFNQGGILGEAEQIAFFDPPFPQNLWGLASGDIDGDGDTDLIPADWGANKVMILLNNGDGTFGHNPMQDRTVHDNPIDIKLFDLSNDGPPEIIMCSNDTNQLDVLFSMCNGDCNQNGTPDVMELSPATDCNGNGILDECDIDFGLSGNCDGDMIPDECEEDCNANGIPDECEVPTLYLWNDPAGGDFGLGSRWCPSWGVLEEPLPVGRAFEIDPGVPYVVTMAMNEHLPALDIRGGEPVFDLGSATLLVSDPLGDEVVRIGAASGVALLTLSSGTLQIGDLGALGSLVIGSEVGGSGELVVEGENELLVSQEIFIGREGLGGLTLSGGAYAQSFFGTIGVPNVAAGTVRVTGAGPGYASEWNVPAQLDIANGTLLVEDEGIVRTSDAGVIRVGEAGRIEGNGTIIGNVVNFGEIEVSMPDTTRGCCSSSLIVFGNVVMVGQADFFTPATGSLRLSISGGGTPTAGILSVQPTEAAPGRLTLGGGLFVEFDASDPPDPNQLVSLDVVTAASFASGSRFDVAVMPGLPPDGKGNGRFLKLQLGSLTRASGERAASVSVVVDTLSGEIIADPQAGEMVAGSPSGAAIGDLGSFSSALRTAGPPDGLADVVVVVPDAANPETASGTAVVLFNAGNDIDGWQGFSGSIVVPVGVDPSGVAIGDLDGQAGLDVVVSNRGSDHVSILTNNGAGTLTEHSTVPVGSEPSSVAIGRLVSGDGLDIIVANESDNTVSVLINTGPSPSWGGMVPGSTIPVGDGPTSILASDLDTDKWDDFVVANGRADSISILLNNGSGGFTSRTDRLVGVEPIQVLAVDLDNVDELPEESVFSLVTINRAGESVSIVRNNEVTPGSFASAVTAPLGAEPISIAAADLDGDVDPELIIVTTSGSSTNLLQVLRNDYQDNGTPDVPSDDDVIFAPDENLAAISNPEFVLATDVDGDGDDDLVTVGESALVAGRGMMSEVAGVVGGTFCPGDTNSSRTVDFEDLNLVLLNWGGSGPEGDLDRSGGVDFVDLNGVLSNWGASCQ
ncbi:MAG: VCBS repeat-containing protein [Phycisphaerales bacterium]|nr:VCBS repeat-containing protein [Phycisphaerales bacterium]